MMRNSRDFQIALNEIFESNSQQGKPYVSVNSGFLHRELGGYPSRNHRMPVCCEVMRSNMKRGDGILEEPPSGQGANLTIRFKLPRE